MQEIHVRTIDFWTLRSNDMEEIGLGKCSWLEGLFNQKTIQPFLKTIFFST